ncbi:polysaccharide deacetylase [Alkalilimnicola ehrlichii]|uniref:Polysaccharide deacetylase n=2 Tax=Alkalilimnicola ehrlichii TaxID=351052 RepID=A0A3E0WJ07_9GAMM|nr:polysaccharide deacetylase [Alkalilimnicola ehrlichii]RFA32131.1 polysaccharide deacetylase [Alkalilimnicola ehrlichii]
MRNAMTVDVEDYFHVAALASAIKVEDWEQCERRVEANTHRLLELFDDKGVTATFFVLGWVAERHVGLIRAIADQGHEIASHGQSHQLIYRQTPDQFRQETRYSKQLLEDLVQRPVIGYRAASYSITPASTWALDILVEEGFLWDSSIFPVRHDRYGMPDSPRWPYRLRTPAGYELIEFPLTTYEFSRYRLPVAGGGYFRLYPYRLTEAALARINARERRPFIFYLHPWEIDPGQPRVSVGALSAFRHYTNLDRCESRLRRLLDKFSFTTVTDVLAEQGLHLPKPAPLGAPAAVDAVSASLGRG